MKLMIMGHARHGKDTVCEILQSRYGMTFKSSSLLAAEIVIYPTIGEMMGYSSVQECFDDRHNHRALWYELIKAYNHVDAARLATRIYEYHDIYCGIRNILEFQAAREKRLFDWAIWVDASRRLPAESTSSCTVTIHDADYVLHNNGTMDQLERQIEFLMDYLRNPNLEPFYA